MKKFNVGDYIKGIKSVEKSIYGWTTEEMTLAKVIKTKDDKMTIKVLGHSVKSVIGNEYEVEMDESEFVKIDFKKDVLGDLPFGTVIKLANDDEYVIANSTWYGEDEYSFKDGDLFDEDEFNDDLEYIGGDCDEEDCYLYNIQKITYGTAILYIREPKEVKEMTLEEICKELGYNVKIVKNGRK